MRFLLKLDSLSYKFLKKKKLLELSCDDSKDDYIGTVIFAMFREFEYERKNITDLLVRYRNEELIYSAYINISDRKLRNIKRNEIHTLINIRICKFLRKQFLNEYLVHMRVARNKFGQHREDAMYEFKNVYDLEESDVSSESLLRLWSRKRHDFEI